ncbi:MAG: diaminopimelate decarboxylase [Bacteroidetes bacterium]|nr:diaminopimelate decarboxylase [Bacteroidota bacterium]
MIKGTFPIDKLRVVETPFYFYDLKSLGQNLEAAKSEAARYGYHVHYAVKANANDRILQTIAKAGFGADCVSGGEVEASVKAGFPADKVVFAGVGKADWEINLGLDNDIFCFNAESIPELEVINGLAAAKGKKARIALRINPNVDAHTHHYITTGLNENKFGFNMEDMEKVVALIATLSNIELIGIHFHIGSQITDMCPFQNLCVRVNEIQNFFEQKGIKLAHVNVGGGLGINYEHPNHVPVPDFEGYFRVFHHHLQLRPGQQLHFELGRAMVASCGSLITKVLYVKQGSTKKFAIVDAGMTDLIRPALYQAYHHIENITSDEEFEPYDVVGPICESSDTFGTARMLNGTRRGDLIALRSAGAYGEIMASRYNLRRLPGAYYSDSE